MLLTIRRVLLAALLPCIVFSQNITRFAGIYNALDYAYGVPGSSPAGLKVSVGNAVTGIQSVTLDFGYTTLSDGTRIFPLSTNAAVMVGTEIVTPVSTSCLSPTVYSTCQITANFTRVHGPGDNVASGTYGLQEAINTAHILGGAVVIDGKWVVAGGTQGMIDSATIPANTAINDNRLGQVFGSGGGGSGTVTSVATSSPLTGGPITHSGTIGCQAASASQAGCLSAADYTAFTGKQNALTLPLSVANGGTGTATPGLVQGTNVTITGTWPNQTINSGGGGAGAFSAITAGVNLGQALTVGNGSVLSPTGTGQIYATNLARSVFSGLPSASVHSFESYLVVDNITATLCSATSLFCYSNGTNWYEVSAPGGGGSGTANHIRSGVLGSIPGTCAACDVYFATDQPAGEQLYQCSAANTWTQTFLHDTTIVNTAGSFGVNLSQFCQLTNSCTVAALHTFTPGIKITPTVVGSLGSCGGGNEGQERGVTDALAPTYLAPLVGGGAVHVGARCNGTAWVAD